MNNKIRRFLFSGALLGASWFCPRASAALVDLGLLITPLVGSFQYDITVKNNSLLDLTLVSIVDAPVADALIGSSLVAASGFLALYDSGLGIIDLLENTSTFRAGSTVTGFRFRSTVLAGSKFTTFEAINVNGDSFRGVITLTGASPVPEGGSTVTLASFGLALMALVRGVSRPRRTSGELV